MTWWLNKDIRMIQNNFRDTDAGLNVDRYVETLLEFGANTCMVGCGGITSFYPTDLPFQTVSPYLKHDLIGELVRKCHDKGIRVITRFDFSKTDIRLLAEHPEWYARSVGNKPILYHDTAATCLNGEYQQKLSKAILTEVISRYPVDGVFFNMFGYQTFDYSGIYVGICQCDNCKARFKLESGRDLPTTEDANDPVYRSYVEFRRSTVDQLLHEIADHVHTLNPNVAISTYNYDGVDLVRNESNSAVDRPLPFFLHNSEHNSGVVRDTYQGQKISSNCAINAVDIYYRFMGVSNELNRIRLLGSMAKGEALDWCIIGDFEDYPDKENFDSVKRIFWHHKRYSSIYSQIKSMANIMLLVPDLSGSHSPEYRGLLNILTEAHCQFDIVDVNHLSRVVRDLAQYDVVIMPGITEVPESFLKAARDQGIYVIATASSLHLQPELLERYFKVGITDVRESVRGCYLKIEPGEIFANINKEWLFVDKAFSNLNCLENTKGYMPFIETHRYGPPERCHGHEITNTPGVCLSEDKWAYFPWAIGEHYHNYGYEAFKKVFISLLGHLDINPLIELPDLPQVEVFFDRCGDPRYLLQLLNLSGFNGSGFFEPHPLQKIDVDTKSIDVGSCFLLSEKGMEELKTDDHAFTIPTLERYTAILIEEKVKYDK